MPAWYLCCLHSYVFSCAIACSRFSTLHNSQSGAYVLPGSAAQGAWLPARMALQDIRRDMPEPHDATCPAALEWAVPAGELARLPLGEGVGKSGAGVFCNHIMTTYDVKCIIAWSCCSSSNLRESSLPSPALHSSLPLSSIPPVAWMIPCLPLQCRASPPWPGSLASPRC